MRFFVAKGAPQNDARVLGVVRFSAALRAGERGWGGPLRKSGGMAAALHNGLGEVCVIGVCGEFAAGDAPPAWWLDPAHSGAIGKGTPH
jgi:hypothetical protein